MSRATLLWIILASKFVTFNQLAQKPHVLVVHFVLPLHQVINPFVLFLSRLFAILKLFSEIRQFISAYISPQPVTRDRRADNRDTKCKNRDIFHSHPPYLNIPHK